MPVEIEAKFRVDDPEAIGDRLRAAGAEPVGEVLQQATYFDTPDRRLQAADAGVRVRTWRDAQGRHRSAITYKGPDAPGELKMRPEEETEVGSGETAAAILAGLGFHPTVRFQKRRWTYRLGPAEVALDELPGLGWFVEVEAPDEPAVQAVRRQLGLADAPAICTPYVAMVAEHLRGSDETELRF